MLVSECHFVTLPFNYMYFKQIRYMRINYEFDCANLNEYCNSLQKVQFSFKTSYTCFAFLIRVCNKKTLTH